MRLPLTARAVLISLLVVLPLKARAADPPAASEPLDFGRHVMPLVDRLGCNTAACHGATAGQGSLKLSLFGADAKGDFDAVTREAAGRRVDRVEPADSLLLLKATQTVPHQGGKRLEPGSPEYELLRTWIAQGAVLAVPKAPTLAALEIAISKRTLSKGESLALVVTGVFSDGSRRDLTAEARYSSSDATVVSVDKGTARAEGCGQAAVLASYRRKAAVVQIVVPQTLAEPFPARDANNKIDELVYAKLKELGIPPSEGTSDAVFLRRVYLDVIGTLPTVAEARAFVADADPEKRAKLIDRLLASEEFADYWAMKWSDLFRIKSEYPSNLWPNAVQAYHHWIRDAIASNKPYDQFARELLTATGSNFRAPAANFYRAFLKRDPQTIGEVTALVFMGARIGCARCHGHPTEDWSLDDDLGMAAFFAPLRYKNTREWKEEIVYIDPRSTFRHPQTGELIVPRLPGGPAVEVRPGDDPREKFAAWLTAPENPWFAKNVVNRTWFWLLGRGIVHEPDDLRSTNPPENPELLDYMAQELVAQKFDLKHVYRLILNSRTYQRSARTSAANAPDVAHFSHYYVKRLGAETLMDAIGQVTERWDTYRSIIPEPFVVMPEGFRATHLADGSISLPFLELFGRPPRDSAYESDRDLALSLRQTLHLLNSSDVQIKVNSSPRLVRLAKETPDDAKVVEDLYLATLSRLPTDEERTKIADYMSGKGKTVPEALVTAKDEAVAALNAVTAELKKATAEAEAAEKAAKAVEAALNAAKETAEKAVAIQTDAEKAAATKRQAATETKQKLNELVEKQQKPAEVALAAATQTVAERSTAKATADKALADATAALATAQQTAEAAEKRAQEAEAAAKTAAGDGQKSEEEKKRAADEATVQRRAADEAKKAVGPIQEKQQQAQAEANAAAQKWTEAEAAKKGAEQALTPIQAQAASLNHAWETSNKTATEAEAAVATAKTAADTAKATQEVTAEKNKLAEAAKARREQLANDQKAADARASAARKTLAETKAAIQPGREQAFQDLLWALLNTKEFLFNH